MPKVICLVLSLLVGAAIGSAQVVPEEQQKSADPSLDGVVRLQAPSYGQYRVKTGGVDGWAAGPVVVDVEVDATGSVVSASGTAAPDLGVLVTQAEQAARQWKFVPSDSEQSRHFLLRFSFDGPLARAEPRGVRVRYERPLTLHVVYVNPTVVLLKRVDGKIPEKTCSVHHIPMRIELVPVYYGLPPGLEPGSPEERAQSEYREAEESRFPNAPTFVRGFCTVSSEKQAEVYVCPLCRKARNAWFAQHPGFEPVW